MIKFRKYDEIVNENVEIPLMKDPTRFLEGILTSAKKKKILKRLVSLNGYGYRIEELRTRTIYSKIKPKYVNNQKIEILVKINDELFSYSNLPIYWAQMNDGTCIETYVLTKALYGEVQKTLNPAYVMVLSETFVDRENLSTVFDKEIVGFLQKQIFRWKSSEVGPVKMSKDGIVSDVRDLISSPLYATFLKYDLTIENVEPVTLEEIKKLPEYSDFIESFPMVQCISTEKQLKKLSLVFGIPKEYVIDPNKAYTREDSDYFYTAYGLSERGYVRKYATYKVPTGFRGDYESTTAKIDVFNSSTLEGWQQGLVKLKQQFEKLMSRKNLEIENVRIFRTKEELHRNRGRIAGSRFGI